VALFKIDPKAKSEVSIALWIPSIWMLILGSRMVSLWFGDYSQSAESYVEGSPLDAKIFLALIVSAFVIVIKRRLNFSEIVKNNCWIFLFLLYCAYSITWSDFPLVSFKRYIKEIGNLLMVFIVLSENNPVESIKTLFNRCAYILIPYSIVLYKYYPALGRGYNRWTGELFVSGVTNDKNSLGILCALCGIGLFWNLLLMWRNKAISANKLKVLIQAFILAMTIHLLWMAKSATSKVCFILGLCILAAVTMEVVRKHIKSYILFGIFIVSLFYMLVDFGPLLMATLGRDETLTGRTEIWGQVIEMVANPAIGVGYGSFWLGDRLESLWNAHWFHPTEAHNGYLEIYLDLGIIGIVLLLGIIISSFRTACKALISDFGYGSLRLAILTICILYNMTESAFRVGLLIYFSFLLATIQFSFSDKIPN
jgi:O-antigen ligase